MQAFGLLSLLITIALAAWWFSGTISKDNDSNINNSNYGETIDSAHDAASKMGGTAN